jgi:hypothetical protein
MSVFPICDFDPDPKWRFVLNDRPDFPPEDEIKQYAAQDTVPLREWDTYYLKFYAEFSR